jgi:hypothetical protein
MQAVEFITEIHDGIIRLPVSLQTWNEKTIKVILLTEENVNDPMPKPMFPSLKSFRATLPRTQLSASQLVSQMRDEEDE